MLQARATHKCAAVTINQEKIIVVSPGARDEKSVEFLVFSGGKPEWIQGPPLPEKHNWIGHQMVASDDTLFYINTNHNIFMRLECQDIYNCQWIEMTQKLQIRRSFALISLIPDEWTECV